MKFLKDATKVELVDINFEIRADWTEEDMLEAGYSNSGEMLDALYHTYDRSYLIELIMEHRYDGYIDDKMPRCPYDIGDEQKQCPEFEMMEDFEEGQPFYCTHCLIDNSKGWCEQGIEEVSEDTTNVFGGDTGVDADHKENK